MWQNRLKTPIPLTVNDQEYLVHPDIFGKKPLTHFSKEEPFSEVEYRLARRFALLKLSRRSYLSAEIEKLLNEKTVTKTTIGKVIEKLTSEGYLNDNDWIQACVEGEKRRGKGPGAIKQKLQFKGVEKESAQLAVSHVCTKEEQKSSICKLMEKKLSGDKWKDKKEREKFIASMMRKGFSYERIKEAFEEFKTQNIV